MPTARNGMAAICSDAVISAPTERTASAANEMPSMVRRPRITSRIAASVVEPRRLQAVHRGVAATGRDQLVVPAVLDHAAVLEHDDAVGAPHRREPVRDRDRGHAPGELEEAL